MQTTNLNMNMTNTKRLLECPKYKWRGSWVMRLWFLLWIRGWWGYDFYSDSDKCYSPSYEAVSRIYFHITLYFLSEYNYLSMSRNFIFYFDEVSRTVLKIINTLHLNGGPLLKCMYNKLLIVILLSILFLILALMHCF